MVKRFNVMKFFSDDLIKLGISVWDRALHSSLKARGLAGLRFLNELKFEGGPIFVEVHSKPTEHFWVNVFTGFVSGFAYTRGLETALEYFQTVSTNFVWAATVRLTGKCVDTVLRETWLVRLQ